MSSTMHVGFRGRCSVHLVNGGVTTFVGEDGETGALIEWGVSVPSGITDVTFTCFLDSDAPFICK